MAFQTLSPDTVTSIATEIARKSVTEKLLDERNKFVGETRDGLHRRLLIYEKASEGEHSAKKVLERHLADLAGKYQDEVREITESIENFHIKEVDQVVDINVYSHPGRAEKSQVVDLFQGVPVIRKDGAYLVVDGKFYISAEIHKKIEVLIGKIVAKKVSQHLKEIKANAVEVIKDSRKPLLARLLLSIAGRSKNIRFEDNFAMDLTDIANDNSGKFYDSLLDRLKQQNANNKGVSKKRIESEADKLVRNNRDTFKVALINALLK